jgi:hypothetical protein
MNQLKNSETTLVYGHFLDFDGHWHFKTCHFVKPNVLPLRMAACLLGFQ